METGTGKTYVYLRTIFELNKRYGFTKFVIVVPSVAIKEGVYKTLAITEDHFRGLYAGAPFEYFLYDSAKLGQVRNFATSPHIQVMVVTVGAINKKDVNNLYKDSEKTGGEKPIDLIKATRPIVIVDEPQSVDGGLGRGQASARRDGSRSARCAIRPRMSKAPHGVPARRGGRLRAQACQADRGGVGYGRRRAQQAVRAPRVGEQQARSHHRARRAGCGQRAAGVRRQEVVVQDGDDLEQTTKRAIYADCRVGGDPNARRATSTWSCVCREASITCKLDQAWGDVDALAVQREMIRRTISEHLDKEKRLRPQGIKVLSLFFIDAVERYRQYDADGSPVKGDYARIFEEEYCRLAQASGLPDALSRGGPGARSRGGPQRLLLDRQEGRLDGHRARTTRPTATTLSGPTA